MAEPGPPISAYRPDWSPRLPTLTFLSSVCAKAVPAKTRLVVIASAARDGFIFPPSAFFELWERLVRALWPARLHAPSRGECRKFHHAEYVAGSCRRA